MQFFNKTPNFDFLKNRFFTLTLSSILIVASIASIGFKGFHFGVDFNGGTIIQILFHSDFDLEKIRKDVGDELKSNIQITTFGENPNEILITLPKETLLNAERSEIEIVKEHFTSNNYRYEVRRVESVGPKVGSELKYKAIQAIIYALGGILIYIWFRFKLIYGLGAIIALFHDVLITLGIFSILQHEINLTIVAAILTIVGYSLNDTIVVFDRIRENILINPKRLLLDLINKSINESLSRTILTSLTTLLVVLSLYIYGGEIIRDFSFALLIGIVVGTYSSIFVASPTLLLVQIKKN